MMHIILCWVEKQTKTLHVQSILPLLDNKPAEDINTPFQKLILKKLPQIIDKNYNKERMNITVELTSACL